MRAIPIVFLALLFLLGGLGWLLLADGEDGGPDVATLEREDDPQAELVPATMAAPKPSTRKSVEVSDAAKARALLDVRVAPEAEVEAAIGAFTVIVTNENGEPLPDLSVIRHFKGEGHKYSATRVNEQTTDEAGRARFEGLVVGPNEFVMFGCVSLSLRLLFGHVFRMNLFDVRIY